MNRTIVATLVAVMATVGMATSASAEDVSFHLSGGPSEQSSTSNADALFTHNNWQLGENGRASAMFKLVPNLSVGPEVSAFYFQDAKPDNHPAILWHYAAAVRLQGSRDAGWSPYLDGSFGFASEDHVYNPSMSVGLGADFALEETHTFWAGPFANWTHTWDTNTGAQASLTNGNAFNAVTVGLSFSFDLPIHPKVVEHTKVVVVKTPSAPVATPAVCPPVVAVEPARPPQPNPLFMVMFDKNSSALTDHQTTTLDSLVAYMKANPRKFAVVQGRASSEGPKAYNLTLSKARADVVVAYLRDHGVDASRAVASGAGGVGNPNNHMNRNTIVIVLR